VTVGYYSPLPPARTGVADYAASLLNELRRHGKIAVAPDRCDVPLYHIGNNSLHAAIYRRALQHPGVVVLHDAVLHHFLLGQLDQAAYIEEFVYNYGEWSRGLARDLWKARAASGSDPRYFAYPMLRRIAESARAVVVHNPAAARVVREHATSVVSPIPLANARGSETSLLSRDREGAVGNSYIVQHNGAPIVEIPHLFVSPTVLSPADALRYRVRLGVAPGAFLFGVLGYLRESKRLMAVLEVFERLHRELPRTALLVAGQFVSQDLERAAAPLLNQAGVIRLPHLPEREFWMAASAVDACINLRYPAAGETSGIAIRFMGIGKPVMLTDSVEYGGIPEAACLRIAPVIQERDSLWEHMVLLTSIPEVAGAVGQRGAAHVQAHHRVDQCAEAYWKVLSDVAA
jgi:glycosyltransferase involved in cell wall biosynthesis